LDFFVKLRAEALGDKNAKSARPVFLPGSPNLIQFA
jgi:hypothetical protein